MRTGGEAALGKEDGAGRAHPHEAWARYALRPGRWMALAIASPAAVRWALAPVTTAGAFSSFALYSKCIGVTSSTLNSALNWVWLGVALCALLWLALQELQRRHSRGHKAGLRRLLAVLLAAFAIFPAVSSSDDLLSYSLLSSQFGRDGGYGSQVPEDPVQTTTRVQLAKILESLEHVQTAAVYALALFIFFLSYICVLRPQLHARTVACLSGRSPPSA